MRDSQYGAALLVTLALTVAPGPSAHATVELRGLSRTTEKIVRANLALDNEACAVPEARVRRLYCDADQQIRQALEVYGYCAPTIDRTL